MEKAFTITRIAIQGKRKKSYAAYSGEVLLFEINEDTLVHYALHKDIRLEEAVIHQIRHHNDLSECTAQAFRYLARRAHLGRELATKLRQKGYPRPLIDDTLALLEEKQLLDDGAFIRMYIREKIKLAHSGPLIIQKKLQEKGADRDIVSEILTKEYSEERQTTEALTVLRKKFQAVAQLPKLKQKEKLRRALQGKGFFGNVVPHALRIFEKENSDTNNQ